jgi:hypothetical protein
MAGGSHGSGGIGQPPMRAADMAKRSRRARSRTGRAAHACVGRPGHSGIRHGGGSDWRARTRERGERAGARRAGPPEGVRTGSASTAREHGAGVLGGVGGAGGWAKGRWAVRRLPGRAWLSRRGKIEGFLLILSSFLCPFEFLVK